MKDFARVIFNPAKVKRDLAAFGRLLQSKKSLAEKQHILPFFRKRKHLSSFIGTFTPNIGPATEIAYEFPFFGDFAADLLVGNRERGEFCVVEFEDGRSDSIFTKVGTKSTKEWSRRFDHGFSQLVDWFYSLDDLKKSNRFAKDFGRGPVRFFGLLIIGRTAGLSESNRVRLKWRTEKVLVDSHAIDYMTFDDLHEFLNRRVSYYPEASVFE